MKNILGALLILGFTAEIMLAQQVTSDDAVLAKVNDSVQKAKTTLMNAKKQFVAVASAEQKMGKTNAAYESTKSAYQEAAQEATMAIDYAMEAMAKTQDHGKKEALKAIAQEATQVADQAIQLLESLETTKKTGDIKGGVAQ